MPTHLVTGATGFVGGALVLELLQRTDDPILALTRPGAVSAQERITQGLAHAAALYGLDLPPGALRRVSAVPGDVTLPGCGVEPGALRADVLWHSAASLRYEDRYLDEIRASNVDGTANTLALAAASGVTEVNQISTAYVAGGRRGHILESTADPTGAQNHYERSKIDAEGLVRAWDRGTVRVMRPSIVVGHSATLGATTFSGLYGFTRQLLQYRGILDRLQRGLYATHAMQIRAQRDQELNLIAVDQVASEAVSLALGGAPSGYYHLTRDGAPTIGESVEAVFELLGFAPPRFVADDAELDWVDAQFDKRLDFYGSYIRATKTFDRRATDAGLGPDRPRHALAPVGSMVRWYLDELDRQRQSAA